MPTRATWSTLEDAWPQSINQAVDWINLRRGECSIQDQLSFALDGPMKYSESPKVSSSFVAREFVDPAESGDLGTSRCKRVWAYSRWWRINVFKPYRFEYTDLGEAESETFAAVGYFDFNQDGDSPIRLVVPDGEGRWFVLKYSCGYTISNANGAVDNFKQSSAYYGIGNSNTGSWYSNAVISGNVLTTWDCGGSTNMRHFMWDGNSGAAELSRNVRTLSAAQGEVRCSADWSQNIVIAGRLVYDLDLKRVYYFSGADTASYTTRAYHHKQYLPVTVYKFAFITTGASGSFEATMEYGQVEDGLEKTRTFKVEINDRSKNRFRHVWMLENPVTCRVFRLSIANLTGTGISQIEVLSESSENADGMDDAQ